MTSASAAFDYEAKRWGGTPVWPRPWYLQGLKLRYCLEDLRSVRGICADLGCGAGNMAKAIKRLRPDLAVHGVDVSRAAIETAAAEPQGVEFRVAPADRLPFGDATLDAVTMFDVLEHLEAPDKVLAEVARVLRPGALFHLALPLEGQRGTIYPILARRGWDAKRRHCGHIQAFDQEGFGQRAAAAGLAVRRVRWSFHLLFQLVDVAYYRWLDARGPALTSVEEYVAQRSKPVATTLNLAKGALSTAGWWESRLLRQLPGGCGHFSCRRGSIEPR